MDIDDGSEVNFFDWAMGEPVNANEYRCVSVDLRGQYYADDCFSFYPFVCGVSEVGINSTVVPGTTRSSTPNKGASTTVAIITTTTTAIASTNITISVAPIQTTTPWWLYVPCGTYITFSADNSKFLSSTDFSTQIQFIYKTIGLINHPERLQYTNGKQVTVPWKSNLSIPEIQNCVKNSTQIGDQEFSLKNVLEVLLQSYTNYDPSPPIGALVFISDTSNPENYEGADDVVKNLKTSGFKLTFILMSLKVDKSKLTKYTDDFILWTNMSNPKPDNWDDVYREAYACDN
ncbi:hypothetical protein FO519_005655 [Halicephalobus sp. NKZ332]|nr:hypothetical protein FO519_005655 [Halicephalobus sp. NKZ332]